MPENQDICFFLGLGGNCQIEKTIAYWSQPWNTEIEVLQDAERCVLVLEWQAQCMPTHAWHTFGNYFIALSQSREHTAAFVESYSKKWCLYSKTLRLFSIMIISSIMSPHAHAWCKQSYACWMCKKAIAIMNFNAWVDCRVPHVYVCTLNMWNSEIHSWNAADREQWLFNASCVLRFLRNLA
jgi:hypothetical protein